MSTDNSRAPAATRLRYPGHFVLKQSQQLPLKSSAAAGADAQALCRLVASTSGDGGGGVDDGASLCATKEYSYLADDQQAGAPSIGALPPEDIRLVRLLGSGDFGSVYLTRQQRRGGDGGVLAAVKLLPRSAKSASEALLHLEASCLADRSPHVLLAWDWFSVTTQTAALTSALLGLSLDLAWSTLSDLVRLRNGLEEERLVELFAQLADGLAFLHHQVGIIHGDLKTDNVLLTFDGRANIADLGSATRLTWGASLPAGQPPLRFGSRFHAPPESYRAGAAIWHVADWFAFGVCAFQTFFGGRLATDAKSGSLLPDPNYMATVERWLQLGHARTFCHNEPIKSYPSQHLANLLRSLLCAEPDLRIGAAGAAQVQCHPLFKEYDWTALRRAEYHWHRHRFSTLPALAPLLPCDVPALVDVRSTVA